MIRKTKATQKGIRIALLAFGIPIIIIGIVLIILLRESSGIGFGIFVLICGIALIGVYFYIAQKKNETQVKNNLNILPHLEDSLRKTEFMREMLIATYLDIGENLFNEFDSEEGTELTNIFDERIELITEKIREHIKEQEKKYGTSFLFPPLDEKPNEKDYIQHFNHITNEWQTIKSAKLINEESKKIKEEVGKFSYALTLYYVFDLELVYPTHATNEIIAIIIKIFDEDSETKLFDRCTNFTQFMLLLTKKIEDNF